MSSLPFGDVRVSVLVNEDLGAMCRRYSGVLVV